MSCRMCLTFWWVRIDGFIRSSYLDTFKSLWILDIAKLWSFVSKECRSPLFKATKIVSDSRCHAECARHFDECRLMVSIDHLIWTHFSHFGFWILLNFDLWSQKNEDLLYSKQLKLCQIQDVMQNVLGILMSADWWFQ